MRKNESTRFHNRAPQNFRYWVHTFRWFLLVEAISWQDAGLFAPAAARHPQTSSRCYLRVVPPVVAVAEEGEDADNQAHHHKQGQGH